MEDRYRGITTSLTLVTMTALMVAFGSSAKRHTVEDELHLLRQRVDRLAQTNQDLEEKLRWAEGKYAQFMTLGKRLNEALLQEQARNRVLSERLRKFPQDAPETSGS